MKMAYVINVATGGGALVTSAILSGSFPAFRVGGSDEDQCV